ncbi:MAG: hypothetical protein JNK30_15045 [Phenylobacterium sp.]|uniref:hypothetical protein n=1 Tax=Phenylobacterium sp. TaxID=1871053 RepID=UPI001A5AA8DF|nr:hypothetical protein [Phenylobacterium sp.]MBL8772698.1 hypothetical protein [Phenylobacterium sp.]
MSGIETRFGAEEDAERIRAAFYGFLNAHEGEVDGDARISTEIGSRGPRLSVRLWSPEAMEAFLRGLGKPDRRACYE